MFESCIVYILKCGDGSYYIGHTNNLQTRILEHMQGISRKYTAARLPISLVFAKEFETRDEAFWYERQIKGWSRKKKEALIENNFEKLKQLSSRAN